MTTLSQITSLWMWIWIGPVLLGLFAAGALFLYAQRDDLDQFARAVGISRPCVEALVAEALPRGCHLVLSRRRARRAVDPNIDRLLAEVQQLNSKRSDY